jgi:transcriptional regulator with XRE-family HTH domain
MLSQRLRQARKNKKLTQEELAKVVNTKKTTISNYETGYSSPSNEMLNDLADVLEVSTDYLLGRTDDPLLDKPSDKTPEETYDDPDFQLAMRSAQGFSEENKQRVIDTIKMLEEVEKARNQAKGKNNK